MESRRFALLAVLGVIVFFLYQAWQTDYSHVVKPKAASSAAVPATAPATPATVSAPRALAGPIPQAPAEAAATNARADDVVVQTDLLRVRIPLHGAGIDRARLLAYPVDKQHPQDKLALLDDGRRYFVFQAGIAGASGPLTDSQTPYAAASRSYRLAAGADRLEVPLEYRGPGGLAIRQIYVFHRGSYRIDLQQEIMNRGAAPLTIAPYARFIRDEQPAGEPQKFVHAFFGLGIYEQRGANDYRFEKMEFGDLRKTPLELSQTGGWLAMLQQYFIGAIIPPADERVQLSARSAGDDRIAAQVLGASRQLAAGGQERFATRLYIGPKLHGKLAAVAPGLDLTEDYGLLTVVAKPLFWVLQLYHRLTGNWGFAIILLTLTVRLAFFKLSESQYRSMAKMRKFGPRIQELRERYAGDRERLNKAMMELYKKEGFNPLAGCWPLLVQFPVFIALYWVLVQSVELRQAPFLLWLNDLSAPDPYYILPVLYGASMWLQQKLSGQSATMDPTQQKIMNVMPIALTGLFAFFPQGLVLYWLVSNCFTIVQQWVITRRLEREGLRR